MKERINYYILLPVMLLLFLLEATFIAQIFQGTFLPNFVLIFLFAVIFVSVSSDFLYIAFFFGFLFDFFSGSNFGIFTLSFVLTAMAASTLKIWFLKEENFFRITLMAVGTAFVYNLIYLFLLIFIFNADISLYFTAIWQKIIFDCVGAAILVYPAMRLITKKQE